MICNSFFINYLLSHFKFLLSDSCRSCQERASGLHRPGAHLRPAAAICGEECDRGEDGHLHQGGQCDPGDKEPDVSHHTGRRCLHELC